jgi:hypothetical protein
MNAKRIGLGFDLRLNPQLQKENLLQRDQHLLPLRQSPISADPGVWLRSEEIESLAQVKLPEFYNPFYLTKSIDVLLDVCHRGGIPIGGLWPVCFTVYEANVIALIKRYGPGYFEDQPDEEQLVSRGWQFIGFDIVDLDGLVSGLKGCGYVEPIWSQLRDYFGSSLNESGLFDDLLTASQFAEVRALEIRAHAPFVVTGLFLRGAHA